MTALQILPANQRAVLLLRDVLAFSADDTAAILGASVASVTSSLQRARRTVENRLPDTTQRSIIERLGAEATDRIAAQYIDAWERSDTQALVDLLCADATFSMPPHPTWFAGTARDRPIPRRRADALPVALDSSRRRWPGRVRLLHDRQRHRHLGGALARCPHARPRRDHRDRRLPRPIARHPTRVTADVASGAVRYLNNHDGRWLAGRFAIDVQKRLRVIVTSWAVIGRSLVEMRLSVECAFAGEDFVSVLDDAGDLGGRGLG